MDINIERQTEDGYEGRWEERTYTRDYWLKLYAGMALQGFISNPTMLGLQNNVMPEKARIWAESLVDEMFKEES